VRIPRPASWFPGPPPARRPGPGYGSGSGSSRFTLDLATPRTATLLSYGQAAYAVDAVESFQPLFHLLNGDLCYADLASRPWMPCLGNHEVEFDNGPQGFTSYLTRYTLPDNHVPGFGGRWYSFRIGSVLFVCLDADDVVYQDAGAFVTGPAALTPATGAKGAPAPDYTEFETFTLVRPRRG
jgi:hypothetical protein